MKTFSKKNGDHIEYSFWLVFGADGSMRFTRGQPSVGRGERGMSCTASLPKSLFQTPMLTASIGITEEQATTFSIDVHAAAEALSQAVGCDIDLRVTTTQSPPTPEVAGEAAPSLAGSGRDQS